MTYMISVGAAVDIITKRENKRSTNFINNFFAARVYKKICRYNDKNLGRPMSIVTNCLYFTQKIVRIDAYDTQDQEQLKGFLLKNCLYDQFRWILIEAQYKNTIDLELLSRFNSIVPEMPFEYKQAILDIKLRHGEYHTVEAIISFFCDAGDIEKIDLKYLWIYLNYKKKIGYNEYCTMIAHMFMNQGIINPLIIDIARSSIKHEDKGLERIISYMSE